MIINISTFAAFEPDPVFPASGVFRAGLAAFTKLFSDKYAAENIRMNNMLPGFIDSLPEKQEFRSRIPMERYGRTDEISRTVAFLASDGAGYIIGQNIRVNGGMIRALLIRSGYRIRSARSSKSRTASSGRVRLSSCRTAIGRDCASGSPARGPDRLRGNNCAAG